MKRTDKNTLPGVLVKYEEINFLKQHKMLHTLMGEYICSALVFIFPFTGTHFLFSLLLL
jgi:hypothetical protein